MSRSRNKSVATLPANAPASLIRPLQETDSLTISQFADLFGFPVAAFLAAIERQRGALNKPYYSIPDLALRWRCSRGTVYAVIGESEFEVFDLSRPGANKGKKLIPGSVVEKIERARMRSLTKAAA